MTTAEPLRIGILGAARISELSLVAVAARSRGRAAAFAAEHGSSAFWAPTPM